MYGVQKRTLKRFPCRSEDVCRIEEGSTNAYLQHQRAIEEFLGFVEPKYNAAIASARLGNLGSKSVSVAVIAGFISYLMACSPAAMRQNSLWLEEVVKSTSYILDQQGKIPPEPKGLGNKAMTELLKSGEGVIDVDGKYPQALGISNIIDRMWAFGNFEWEVLINDVPGSPFFTSDYPVAIEFNPDPRLLNRIVPLAPDVAVRILPDINLRKRIDPMPLDFPKFRFTMKKLRPKEVRAINKLLVRCAENLVFFRDDHPWVFPFIKKHARYWIEPTPQRIPADGRDFLFSSHRIARRPLNA